MVWPGMNQVLLMPCFFSSASRRGAPTRGPNYPREIHDGEVWPRAMKPEIASKSKVRQTMCRFIRSKNSLSSAGERDRVRGVGYDGARLA